MIQDTFSLTRPQWKLAANLEEAGGAFAEAVAQNYKVQGTEKIAEPEELDERSPSEDEVDEDENPPPGIEEGESSSEDVEVCTRLPRLGVALINVFNSQTITKWPRDWILTLTMKRSPSLALKTSETRKQKLNSTAKWQR